MYKILFLVFSLLLIGTTTWGKQIPLTDVMKPHQIRIDDQYIYIVDNACTGVKLYSKDNTKLIRTIGKKGAGPGEFFRIPFIKVYDDKILIRGTRKVAIFSKKGELLQEIPTTYAAEKLLQKNGKLSIPGIFSSVRQFYCGR